MKHRNLRSLAFLLMVALILTCAITVFARDWSGTYPLTGGSPQRLSTWLVTNGYTGTDAGMAMDYLTVCNPSTNVAVMVFGPSNVTMTTGFPLSPGDCHSWPPGNRPTDAQSIFLRVAATQDVMVTLRSR